MKAVIVGGGIAGIYSALILADKYEKVSLIESSERIGGLLNSFKNEHGDLFDFGTHYIAETGVDKIDEVIIPPEWRGSLYEYKNEHGGNYFKGSLDNDCLFVDARKLDKDEYNSAVVEMLETHSTSIDYENCKTELESQFGKSLTQYVFSPSLCKLYGVKCLSELAVNSHLRFGMKRIKAFETNTANLIKSIESYDNKLSFHRYDEGNSSGSQFYPIAGGAEEWIKVLEQKLDEKGVEVYKSRNITNLKLENGDIKELFLDDETQLGADLIVWTAPPNILTKLSGVSPKNQYRPNFRTTSLIHYVLDQAPLHDCHFYFCYDPDYVAFRVTLYSNMQPCDNNRYRVTVEVLSDDSLTEKDVDKAFNELIKMKVFPENTNILYSKLMNIKNGFPVLNHEFMNMLNDYNDTVLNNINNVKLLGRFSGKSWFMSAVFRDVFQELSDETL